MDRSVLGARRPPQVDLLCGHPLAPLPALSNLIDVLVMTGMAIFDARSTPAARMAPTSDETRACSALQGATGASRSSLTLDAPSLGLAVAAGSLARIAEGGALTERGTYRRPLGAGWRLGRQTVHS